MRRRGESEEYYWLLVIPILWKYRAPILFFLGLAIGLVFGSGTLEPADLLQPDVAFTKLRRAVQNLV